MSPRKPPSSSTNGKVLYLTVPVNANGPQDPEPPAHKGSNRGITVLDCTRDEMTRRWWYDETSMLTIRSKLNVGLKQTERIIRAGLRARFERKKAA